ncbi:hypothetical protein Tco_1346621 [Tanacetum coccineum]
MCVSTTAFFTGRMTRSRTCRISIWKVDNKTHKVYENIPAKVMWYFTIIPRLQQLFEIQNILEDLRWHGTRRITDGVLRHPVDSQAWRTIDEKFPEIAEDPRNLRLRISADRVDVNTGNMHHSVWPVLTVIYNLPPCLHIAFAACICTLHLQLAFASKHLHIAFADCICTLHLYIAFAACICKQAFAHCTCTLHLQAKVLIKTLLKVKQVENKQREKKPRFNKQFL